MISWENNCLEIIVNIIIFDEKEWLQQLIIQQELTYHKPTNQRTKSENKDKDCSNVSFHPVGVRINYIRRWDSSSGECGVPFYCQYSQAYCRFADHYINVVFYAYRWSTYCKHLQDKITLSLLIVKEKLKERKKERTKKQKSLYFPKS